MTDEIFFEAEDELKISLGREPSYEEVLDYLNSKYKEKRYDKQRSIQESWEVIR